MAAGTLHTVAPAARTCDGCAEPLRRNAAPQRRFCDDCRSRRRAATFLRSAHDVLVGVDDGAVQAIDGVLERLPGVRP